MNLFKTGMSLGMCMACMPFTVFAAGTYYNSNYVSPQQRYENYASSTNNYSDAYNNFLMRRGMKQTTTTTTTTTSRKVKNKGDNNKIKQGLDINAGLGYEFAQWNFDMTQAGSKLHYDNVNWFTLGANANYYFNFGNTPAQIDFGVEYGFQGADSTMVDDDITNGGYLSSDDQYTIVSGDVTTIYDNVGHALSVGTTKDGNKVGFYAGVGLTDAFSVGGGKLTPSVGYRYFKYKLETSQNYGMAMDTAACFEVDGEIQCDPLISLYGTGTGGTGWYVVWRDDATVADIPVSLSNVTYVDPMGSYYYQQSGISHSYETTWAGPYVALDLDYPINSNNFANARLELGFPGYTSEGDQPYRYDWSHPKSVEDSADVFAGFHLGFGANWLTALSDAVKLSIGITYDYYSVSGADASTYLNGSYYTELYDYYEDVYNNTSNSTDSRNIAYSVMTAISDLEDECPGWVCKLGSEVDSIYKSLGIRVGLSANF